MEKRDLVIIGAGPAGISAAKAARAKGVEDILLLDRLALPGGILPQCLHRGFGSGAPGKKLNGPEFASLILQDLDKGIEVRMDSAVICLANDKALTVAGMGRVYEVLAKAVILATGCRERPVGALPVCGTRPAGVFTAGSVQKMLNLSGYRVGSRAVVLGSGDVGMIVAHHLAESGTEVLAIVEKEDRVGGLKRNKSLYVDAHGIPTLTRHTVTELHGLRRLEAVTVCKVDAYGAPMPETGYLLPCDTLISSVGLIPELELLQNLPAPVPWLFVCGNARRVYRFAGSVINDGKRAGEFAAAYLSRELVLK